MTETQLRKAIEQAVNSGLRAVDSKAYVKRADSTYEPNKKCLIFCYSSSENVVCRILQVFYFN